jgi:hypothetical protein
MAFAAERFSTVAQNFISREVASNFYKKAQFLAILGALTLGNQKKTSLDIGRPNSGEILSGGIVNPIQKKRLGTVNAYLPRVQKFTTSNSAYRTGSGYVSLPTVANPTTNAHSQATQFAAEFRWSHLDTPILVWHEDKIRAGQEGTREGQGIAMGQIIDEATEVAMQEHIDKLAGDIWTGNPSSQNTDLWDSPLGITQALATTNTYARVDRNTESTWRSNLDSTLKAVDVNRIIDDANLTKQLRVKGNGINLLLTTTDLYQQFKAQILASGGMILQNGLPIDMAKMGVRKEVLQKDNVLITYDPSVPANNVAAFDTSVWKFMLHPQFNFHVGKFIDNTETGLGKEAYDYSYVSTRFMFTCDNPFLNVLYTAIGT